MDRKLTTWILVGMILGVIAGYLVNANVDVELAAVWASWFKLLSDIFLSLVKMLVAPLILSTIVVGIAHMGDSTALGRIGFRAISWFIIASFISIGLGLLLVNFFEPGVGAPVGAADISSIGEVKKLDAREFILHIFPKNFFESMSTNNILQILVFSLFAGVALSAMGEKARPLVKGARDCAEILLTVPGLEMP